MPTALTHGFVAVAASGAVFGGKLPRRFWILAVICSVLPDIDTIGLRLGIPYEHFLGHRGFLHSLTFALILSVLVLSLGFRGVKIFSKRWCGLWAFFFFISGSHGILDAMTDGGLGIALLGPLCNMRYFFPFRPLEVSPIGLHYFFSRWGLAVLRSEIVWVWIPTGLVFVTVRALRAVVSSARRRRSGCDNENPPVASRETES